MKLKLNYALVCDDIRREDNGKFIAIGIYAADIQVLNFPTSMTLSLMLNITNDAPGRVGVGIRYLIGSEVRFSTEGEMGVERAGIGMLNLPPFYITDVTESAILTFQWKLPGKEWEDILSLPIIQHVNL